MVMCPNCRNRRMAPEADAVFCICPWCGDVRMVDERGRLQPPSPEDMAWVRETNEYQMAMMVVQDFDSPTD